MIRMEFPAKSEPPKSSVFVFSRYSGRESGFHIRKDTLAAVGPDRICGFVGHFTAQGAEYEAAEERNDHQGKQGESYGHHGCPFVAPILDADTMTIPE